MAIEKLSDAKIKAAKSKAKQYKLADGGGLFLVIHPNGSKYWRYRYYLDDKEKSLAIGVYPAISLANARSERKKAVELVAQGIDPVVRRAEQKEKKRREARNSFESVAREWYGKQKAGWKSEKHSVQVIYSLERDIFPEFGKLPVNTVSTSQVEAAIQKIEDRGALEIAARVTQRIRAVFKYATQKRYCSVNPALYTHETLTKREKREYKHLTLEQTAELLKALSGYDGYDLVKLAVNLQMLTFLRTGELRAARWSEFELKDQLWRIPAERMKTKVEHLVPLSSQAINLLENIRPISGRCELVFPGRSNATRPMSDNTVRMCIKRLGFDAPPHGFRKTASTFLNESGFSADAVERQLSHGEKDKIRATYNKALYLDERRKMMQVWADKLYLLKGN